MNVLINPLRHIYSISEHIQITVISQHGSWAGWWLCDMSFRIWWGYSFIRSHDSGSDDRMVKNGDECPQWAHVLFLSDSAMFCYRTKFISIWRKDIFTFLDSIIKLLLSSVQFSRSVISDSLWPHESQHARSPCPSATPGVHSDSRPSSPWCHPAISSSVVPFSSCP